MQEKHVAQVTGTMPLIQISNTHRQQFTSNNSNSTFNSDKLTGFPVRTPDETPKTFQSINTLLLCDPSAVLLYSARQAVRHMGLSSASSVSPLLIEISRKGFWNLRFVALVRVIPYLSL
ncbi:hypothetical protein AVEN_121046-1 [Araneus ventricosus]|uniref:Uncharacterized protein n=1 Tax=Araneus ventricosus TaxID=182803 RepID=A0A4Y2F246_ARAVE|nr:hypothetical protein AVEN_121046-1 [Araneus ventricosus]